MRLHGFLYGDRVIELLGDMVFTDRKNDLQCKVTFAEAPGFFSKSRVTSDFFEYFFCTCNS